MTLVDELRSIDNLSEETSKRIELDKKVAAKGVITEAYLQNNLVRDIVNGKTTASQVVADFSKKYEGWNFFLPTFEDKEYDERLEASGLADIVNVYDFYTRHENISAFYRFVENFIANPFVGGFGFGTAIALLSQGHGLSDSQALNYAVPFVVCGLVGAYFGTLSKHILRRTDLLYKDAEFFDEKIEELK